MREKMNGWLSAVVHTTEDGKYRHQRLRENRQKRSEVIEDLKKYIYGIHMDIKQSFEKDAGYSLDPLGDDNTSYDPLDGYPDILPMKTLKGYFGEVFAGIVAENFSPFGEDDWKVPAYLFRFHDAAFQYLERLHQIGKAESEIVGRIGDDCLAFLFRKGLIKKVLYCEAKCSAGHRPDTIAEAHQKVSEGAIVSLYQIIRVMKEKESLEAKQWVSDLSKIFLKKENYDRYDLVSYIHGRLPKQGLSWVPEENPHKNYRADRPLEAVEIHLYDVEDLIFTIYNKEKEPLIQTSA